MITVISSFEMKTASSRDELAIRDGRGRWAGGQAAKTHYCFLIIHHDFYFQSKLSTVYVEAWKLM